MQDTGLSLDWFDVLVNVQQYPQGPMPLSKLADNVVLSRSGLTRLLDRMEAAGLVQRTLSTTDRRRFDVSLTQAGLAEFDRVWPAHQQDVRERFLRYLTHDEMKVVHEGLAKVIEANERQETRAAKPSEPGLVPPAPKGRSRLDRRALG